MSESFVSSLPIAELSLLDKMKKKGLPVHFSLEMNRREKAQAQDRFERWENLGDEQRGVIRDRYQLFRNLTPDTRDRIQDTYRRFQRLPPDRRMELRGQFRSLTPDQLRRLRDTRLRPTDQSGAGTVRGR